jgi:hypothetical protein
VSTLLFPFIYDIGKKFCLSFYYLQLLSKYVSHRVVQTENRPVPPLTDVRVNLYPASRKTITEANQFLVDNVSLREIKSIDNIHLIYFSLQKRLKNVVFDLMLQVSNVYHRLF